MKNSERFVELYSELLEKATAHEKEIPMTDIWDREDHTSLLAPLFTSFQRIIKFNIFDPKYEARFILCVLTCIYRLGIKEGRRLSEIELFDKMMKEGGQ